MTTPTDNTIPILDDVDTPFDPQDVIEAARIYAQAMALKGMLAESSVMYGLLNIIERNANGN